MFKKMYNTCLPPDRRAAAIPMVLFAILASAPFFWTAAHGGFQYIGGGDYLSPLNILDKLQHAVFPFNHFFLAGVYDPGLLAAIPTFVFYYLFQLMGFSPLCTTLLFISLLTFIAQSSFYFCMRYILRHKLNLGNNYQFLTVPGAVIYGFSPYVAALIIPGHFYNLIVYVVFPLLIKHLDLLITSSKINYKSVLVLFLLFMACSLGVGIGTIYVLLIACLIYTASVFLINRGNLIIFSTRFCLFISLIFLSNMWWLWPHLSNLKHIIAQSHIGATMITANVHHASAYATVLNIFMGRPQGMMYMTDIVGNDYYVAGPIMWIFMGILSFFLAGLFLRKKYLYVLAIAMLISIFFVKGPQPPLSDLFMWAYEHIPGFKILRRPDAKFYGFFLFFYWAAAVSAYVLIFKNYARDKLRASLLFLAGFTSAGYLVIIFSMMGGLIPFNIPPMYSRVNDFLLTDGVKRLLILPSTYGLNPVYTAAVNSYNAIDFINEVFAFPIISPDSSDYSANERYKVPTNDLMQLIREGEPICEAARGLGVSHIMVRQDLDRNQAVEDRPARLIAILDGHSDISNKTTFEGAGKLAVYKLNDQCVDGLISTQRDKKGSHSFHFSVLNPTKIVLQFDNLKESVRLDFLTNFNENWKIYPSKEMIPLDGGGFSSFFMDIQYLFRSPLFHDRHTIVNGYANRWEIDPYQVKQKLSPNYYHLNTDGSVNFRLVLYYQTQAYVFVGFLISLLTLGVLLMLRLRQKARELNATVPLPEYKSPE
jgi:hypothetical protein